MTNNSAIITGTPGWLGNRFLDILLNGSPESNISKPAANRQIKALSNIAVTDQSSDILSDQRINFVPGDVRNKESLRPLFENTQDSTVFHMAGIIHPRLISDLYSVNVEGTRNMLELSKEFGVKRFVYISSNSPCGTNKNNNDLFNEDSPYHPYLNYGKSKMLAEQLVKSYADKLEIVILRPPWFYGPEQPARQSLFFKMIRTGKVPIVGDGLNKRSMAYVDNICQALLLAESVDKAKGNTYWIADEKPYTMKKIIQTIETVLERDFKIEVAHKHLQLPDFAGEIAYIVDASFQACGLYNQRAHVLSEFNKTIACDISKAKTELGYNPHVSLEEGMKRSIAWLIAKKIAF
jgi:nucleoside-diphosphate-sugar epimerase